jgi:hypothetical protein
MQVMLSKFSFTLKQILLSGLIFFSVQIFVHAQTDSIPTDTVAVDWNKITSTSKTTATLQVVENPIIESIRKRLSPKTITTINEIGTIINASGDDIPNDYWNLSGAMYAYVFLQLTQMGIDVAGESQLVGYPTQFPDVSMIDWKNGNPNARYWVLKLLKDNFSAGDKLVQTSLIGGNIISQAFITTKGERILFINPHNKEIKVHLPDEAKNAVANYVDASTGENAPAEAILKDGNIRLKPFAVTVVQLN